MVFLIGVDIVFLELLIVGWHCEVTFLGLPPALIKR
jgi:hypothetical protein